ncbi:hypothetical protein PV433_18330 [Paenibacillus sp. GYB004]|uniref:hypothetical protein n=1 Tax=Paenibacillus sp. GYB004 TaxID=2994393 RepID=UPI002F96C239
MHKLFFILIICTASLLVSSCQQKEPKFESHAEVIKVMDKKEEEQKLKWWIEGERANTGEKVIINMEQNVWNLLELKHSYLIGYEKSKNKTFVLTQIFRR